MVKLIPIQYRNKQYPRGIILTIQEIPAHFDANMVETDLDYSLHTEYSYASREFTSSACANLDAIKTSDRNGVPSLWFDENWVKDFIDFIINFIKNNKPPKIIEIHPPFDNYCKSLDDFIGLYEIFEKQILLSFPETEILIENRYGSLYSGGNFVVSTVNHLNELVGLIRSNDLKLKIALDIPQLFSAHNFTIGNFIDHKMSELFNKLKPIKDHIASIHLWGKCYGRNNRIISHMGTLDSYFRGLSCDNALNTTMDSDIKQQNHSESIKTEKNEIKALFLNNLYDLLNDGLKRYFVPEVNSKSEHLQAIVNDLRISGFRFE